MKKIIIALTIGFIIGATAGFAISKMFSNIPTNEFYSNTTTSLPNNGIPKDPSDKKSPDSLHTNTAVQISSTIPSDTDGFALADAISIEGDTLKVNVGYSGGCADHEFTLLWSGMFLESYPVQADLFLLHDNKEDICEAYEELTIEFDLTPIKDTYTAAYQSNGGLILMTIHGSRDKKQSITYEF